MALLKEWRKESNERRKTLRASCPLPWRDTSSSIPAFDMIRYHLVRQSWIKSHVLSGQARSFVCEQDQIIHSATLRVWKFTRPSAGLSIGNRFCRAKLAFANRRSAFTVRRSPFAVHLSRKLPRSAV